MRPGRAADHSPPSSAAVMEESTHPLGRIGPVTAADRHQQEATPIACVLKPDEATTCVNM